MDINDGENIYNGTASFYNDTNLEPVTNYFYKAWSYSEWNNPYTNHSRFSDINNSANCTTHLANPIVITINPTNINSNNFTLNGILSLDGGNFCNVSFEYGETIDYGNFTEEQTINTTLFESSFEEDPFDADFASNTENPTGKWLDSYCGKSRTGDHWAYSFDAGATLTTPLIDLSGSTKLTFWYRAEDAGYPMSISVYVDDSDLIWSDTVYNHTTYQKVTVDLTDYSGEHDLSFVHENSDFYGTCLDDVKVESSREFNLLLSNLSAGQIYHYRTKANNSQHTAYGENKIVLTKPIAPINLSANAQSTNQIDLIWEKGNGTNQTVILRNKNNYPNNRTDGVEIYNDTGTIYSDTDLTSNTKYYYRAWSYSNWTYDQTNYIQFSQNYDSTTATTDQETSGGSPTPSPSLPGSSEDISNENQQVNNELTTKEKVENLFDLTLDYNFSAEDSDSNGIIDSFYDPNNKLFDERVTTIDGNTCFIISVEKDDEKLFLWDTQTDEINLVKFDEGEVINTSNDEENNKIIVTVKIEKANWTYFEVTDTFTDILDIEIKRENGTIIPKDLKKYNFFLM